MVPYTKHVGLWLLLSCGTCGIASNVAALFGYSGRYTFVLVIGCVVLSLVLGTFSYRLANRKPAVAPRQPSAALMKALSYQDWTKPQRLRWFFAWMGSGAVFLVLDFVVYQTTRHLAPDLMPQIIIAIALMISGSIAALFGVVFYQRVLTAILPD